MSDDYLWDGTGKPDPEVQRLETLLGPLRFKTSAPDFSNVEIAVKAPRATHSRRLLNIKWTLAAATAVAAMVFLVVLSRPTIWRRASYQVVSLSGVPRIGTTAVEGSGRLAVGQWLETDAVSRAKIGIGDIGQVEIEPETRIGLAAARPGEHRLSLQRGTVHALIWAPPRQFYVSTPSALATDLGCAYTLQVDAKGSGLLSVTMGWVAFEHGGREAFVPAGARCETRPGIGPGTPYQGDASPEFHAALSRLDFQPGGKESRIEALKSLLAEAREKDALTLWHLLFSGDDDERALVFDRLAVLVPPPSGVTRAGVLNRNQGMLDVWWDALGLGDTNWWRMWKRPLPANQ